MEIQKNTFTVGKIRIDKDRLYSIGNVEIMLLLLLTRIKNSLKQTLMTGSNEYCVMMSSLSDWTNMKKMNLVRVCIAIKTIRE